MDRACRHVSDLWFPANPVVLDRVERGVTLGVFGDGSAVYDEVRQDVSLFAYCLRELAGLVGDDEDAKRSPRALFRAAGVPAVAEVIRRGRGILTTHTLGDMSPAQEQRVGEMMTASVTAEALAPGSGADGDTCSAAAVLRQLGLTLVAFNYSETYEAAASSLAPGESLDQKLAAALGFSPSSLAASLFREWGLRGTAASAAGDDAAVTDAAVRTVAKVAEVGEALARANNPETYPSAPYDWEVARAEIERRLGKRGMQVIRKRLREMSRSYVAAVPAMFRGGLVLDPEARLACRWEDEHLARNPHIAGCRGAFGRELYGLYSRLGAGDPARECVGMLVRDLVPLSGFSDGCVFTIDPGSRSLVPQLRLGTVRLRKPVPVPYGDKTDPVARAFDAGTPVVSTESLGHDYVTSVTGVLGRSTRVGVMYLEMDHRRFGESDADYLVHFKALAQAFTDALRLG